MKLKALSITLALSTIFGCGGSYLENGDEVDELELGQVEQEVSVRPTTNFTYGVDFSNTAGKWCTGLNSSELCLLPPSKTVAWCMVDGGSPNQVWTTSEKDEMRTNAGILQNIGFSKSEVAFGSCKNKISKNSGAHCTGALVQALACLTSALNPTTLSSPGLLGAYKVAQEFAGNVDMDDINALSSNSTTRQRIRTHAERHLFMALAGQGTTTLAAYSTSPTDSGVHSGGGSEIPTPGQTCQGVSYTTGGSTFTQTGAACSTP